MVRQKTMLLLRYKTVDSQVVKHTVPDNRFKNFTDNTSQAKYINDHSY